VEFKDPHIPIVRLHRLNVGDSLLHVHGQSDKPSTARKLHPPAIELFGTKSVFSEREAIGRR
jgi:hypothetical protein